MTILPTPTPRRLEVLRSVHLYGTVVCVVRYGWQHYTKIYTVRSLTELVDSTEVVHTCRRLGWLRREYPGATTHCLTAEGRSILRQHG